MTFFRLALRGLVFYRRTHLAVVFGVATAVAVLAGALLVGASVRASLAGLVTARLGRTDVVIGAERPFTEALATRLVAHPQIKDAFEGVVPLFMLEGVATHQASGRRAANITVYGVDERFFAFHGVTAKALTGSDAWLSPDLALELGAAELDALVVRVARPTDIPLDSLHGRKDDVGRAMRLSVKGPLGREGMGEFSLAPAQGPVRAVFVALARVQRDLHQPLRVNALLVARSPASAADTASVTTALNSALDADDLGLKITALPDASSILVETSSGLIPDAMADEVAGIARRQSLEITEVLTWLANRLTSGGRSVPYSLVAGVGEAAGGDSRLAALMRGGPAGPAPIVLNDWASEQLGTQPGDSLELEYDRWADEGRLVTDRASFRVAGRVPIDGFAADRRLSPEYPGITDSKSVSDWDPPFPIDLTLVRPVDEAYWDRYRTTAKAFIPIAVAKTLWGTRHGRVSSLRLRPTGAAVDLDALAGDVRTAAARAIGASRAGITVVDVRQQNISASAGATDFGAYFSYFSFFLVVSALLLAALFFRLGIEQRFREIGVLRAAGFNLAAVQKLFVMEGLAVSLAGALVGIGLAIAWAGLMMYGLRTWWVGAVGTTALTLHVDAATLALGAMGGVVTSIVCIAITVRALGRYSPRALMAGGVAAQPRAVHARRRLGAAIGIAAGAIVITALTVMDRVPAAAGFFSAGALVLTSGLMVFSHWLHRRHVSALKGRGLVALARLGIQNTSWRPGRSLTSAGLVAVAAFLIVSVDAFRKSIDAAGDPRGGTGGFALVAETVLPFVHDPADAAGREAIGLSLQPNDPALSGVSIFAARLRPGDDASCLNLYQPKQPRVLGLPDRLIDAARFTFAASLAATDADRANPWLLLRERRKDGAVPAIVDATSLQYVLHAAVGDEVVIDAETARPVRLRIVASLADSVLQGEILVGEAAFGELFPESAGYRVLFIEVAPNAGETLDARVDEVAVTIEDRLQPFGVDAQSAVRKLEAYHRVENTYLSTFQTLGGLGLVLGTIGLAAVTMRNVLERRRELALLSATGYRSTDLANLVLAENVAVVLVGLVVGAAAALLSIAPVLAARGGRPPVLSMVWLMVVALSGVVASVVATRAVRRLPLVASLRNE